MTEKELIEIYKDKIFDNVRQRILQSISNSELALIVWDKQEEIKKIKEYYEKTKKGLRGDSRNLVDLLCNDEIAPLERIIRSIQYIIRCRSPNPPSRDNGELLRLAKESISMAEVVEVIAGVKIRNNRLIKCPLPSHKDTTSSFKVYKNSFYCFGCSRGGSQVDFIMHMLNCSLRDAIQKFLYFYKK